MYKESSTVSDLDVDLRICGPVAVTVAVAEMPSASIIMEYVNVNAADRTPTPLAICFRKWYLVHALEEKLREHWRRA